MASGTVDSNQGYLRIPHVIPILWPRRSAHQQTAAKDNSFRGHLAEKYGSQESTGQASSWTFVHSKDLAVLVNAIWMFFV